MLGLSAGVRACLFDLDGVLTPTAAVHTAARKGLFDELLRRRAAVSLSKQCTEILRAAGIADLIELVRPDPGVTS